MGQLLPNWIFKDIILNGETEKIVCYRLHHTSGICTAYLHPKVYRKISKLIVSLNLNEPYSMESAEIYVSQSRQSALVDMLGTHEVLISRNIELSQLEEKDIYDEYNYPMDNFPIKDISDLHTTIARIMDTQGMVYLRNQINDIMGNPNNTSAELKDDIGKTRPSWDELWMWQAYLISERATCNRLKVGAVLVKDNLPIMQGYNGSLPGRAHCTDVGCLVHEGGCKRCNHAERNVIDHCALEGIRTKGCTLYITHYPCPDCMKAIANVGIKEVVYMHEYKHRYENDFHYGLTMRQYSIENRSKTIDV